MSVKIRVVIRYSTLLKILYIVSPISALLLVLSIGYLKEHLFQEFLSLPDLFLFVVTCMFLFIPTLGITKKNIEISLCFNKFYIYLFLISLISLSYFILFAIDYYNIFLKYTNIIFLYLVITNTIINISLGYFILRILEFKKIFFSLMFLTGMIISVFITIIVKLISPIHSYFVTSFITLILLLYQIFLKEKKTEKITIKIRLNNLLAILLFALFVVYNWMNYMKIFIFIEGTDYSRHLGMAYLFIINPLMYFKCIKPYYLTYHIYLAQYLEIIGYNYISLVSLTLINNIIFLILIIDSYYIILSTLFRVNDKYLTPIAVFSTILFLVTSGFSYLKLFKKYFGFSCNKHLIYFSALYGGINASSRLIFHTPYPIDWELILLSSLLTLTKSNNNKRIIYLLILGSIFIHIPTFLFLFFSYFLSLIILKLINKNILKLRRIYDFSSNMKFPLIILFLFLIIWWWITDIFPEMFRMRTLMWLSRYFYVPTFIYPIQLNMIGLLPLIKFSDKYFRRHEYALYFLTNIFFLIIIGRSLSFLPTFFQIDPQYSEMRIIYYLRYLLIPYFSIILISMFKEIESHFNRTIHKLLTKIFLLSLFFSLFTIIFLINTPDFFYSYNLYSHTLKIYEKNINLIYLTNELNELKNLSQIINRRYTETLVIHNTITDKLRKVGIVNIHPYQKVFHFLNIPSESLMNLLWINTVNKILIIENRYEKMNSKIKYLLDRSQLIYSGKFYNIYEIKRPKNYENVKYEGLCNSITIENSLLEIYNRKIRYKDLYIKSMFVGPENECIGLNLYFTNNTVTKLLFKDSLKIKVIRGTIRLKNFYPLSSSFVKYACFTDLRLRGIFTLSILSTSNYLLIQKIDVSSLYEYSYIHIKWDIVNEMLDILLLLSFSFIIYIMKSKLYCR